MTSFEYDTSYFPPAPVVPVILLPGDGSGEAIRVMALIDSGADTTILPLELLRRLDAKATGRRRLRSVTGERAVVSIFPIAVRIDGHTLYGVQAIGATFATEPILGRDALNQLVITLHGLAEITEVNW